MTRLYQLPLAEPAALTDRVPAGKVDTSVEAFDRMDSAGARRIHQQRIVDYITARAEYGATSHEICNGLVLSMQTVSGRCNDLMRAGLIKRDGDRRNGAYVWRAVVRSGIRESAGRCDVPRSTLGAPECVVAGRGFVGERSSASTKPPAEASRAGQEASRLAHNQETRGSIPRPATNVNEREEAAVVGRAAAARTRERLSRPHSENAHA